MIKETPDGQTQYCKACEKQARVNYTVSDFHTCGMPEHNVSYCKATIKQEVEEEKERVYKLAAMYNGAYNKVSGIITGSHIDN